MSQALRKLTSIVAKSKTCLIFINQLREKIGVMFGNPETTTGGRALKFYASIRLDIRRIASLKEGDVVIGSRAKVKVVKNKVAPPVPRGRVRHPLRRGHQQGRRPARPRRRPQGHREVRRLVRLRRRAHGPGPRERAAVPEGQPRHPQRDRHAGCARAWACPCWSAIGEKPQGREGGRPAHAGEEEGLRPQSSRRPEPRPSSVSLPLTFGTGGLARRDGSSFPLLRRGCRRCGSAASAAPDAGRLSRRRLRPRHAREARAGAPVRVLEGTVVGPDAKPVSGGARPRPGLRGRLLRIRRAGRAHRRRRPLPRPGRGGAGRTPARRGAGLAARTLEKASPGEALRITLARGGIDRGHRARRATGRPGGRRADRGPRGRRVRRGSVVGARGRHRAPRSDAKGRFKLEGLARGRHTRPASSRAAGRATRSGVALGPARRSCLSSPGRRIERPRADVGRQAHRGRGGRAPSARRLRGGRVAPVGSDAAGRFEIPASRPAPTADRAPPGLRGRDLGRRAAGSRGRREVDVVLAAPGAGEGRLVDADERPLPGTVERAGDRTAMHPPRPSRAGAPRGRRRRPASARRVPPGSHALRQRGAGRGFATGARSRSARGRRRWTSVT